MSVLTTGESRRQSAAASASARPVVGSRHSSAAPRRRAPGVPLHGPVHERPPLRLVEPAPRERRVSVGLLGTVCLVAVFLGLFALAAMHSLVVQAQFELDRVDQAVSDRRSQIEERRVEVARLESPAAVVAAAEAIGMVPAADRAYLMPEPLAPTDATLATGDTAPAPTDGTAAPATGSTAGP